MLERAGHRVHLAENGAAAVIAAGAQRFDVILLDGQMPILDGSSAAHQIRDLPSPFNQAAIIALTASLPSTKVTDFHANDIQDYLVKPISAAQLLAAVRKPSPCRT